MGLSFSKHQGIKSIHLVDPSIDVINVLNKKLFDSYITEKDFIKVHCAKGQTLILNAETKSVFIAGMGGKEIQEIVQNLIAQLSPFDRLIISPHRNILELRKYLQATELGLLDEIVIEEDGQFYQILCLVKGSNPHQVPLYGSKIWLGSIGEKYRQHQLQAFSCHQDELSKAYVTYLGQLNS